MTCPERRSCLTELARAGDSPDPETQAHLALCEECGRFLEEQRTLGGALARIAAENAAAVPPAGIEEGVFAEWRSEFAFRKVWRGLAAATIAALLAIGIYMAPGPVRAPAPQAAAPFIEIPYVAPFAPYERASVERMDVPVAALVAAGFEVHVPDASGTVKADVLVGQDGRPHAIRLVPEVNR